MDIQMKQCNGCKKLKPFISFFIRENGVPRSHCKKCHRSYQVRNQERIIENYERRLKQRLGDAYISREQRQKIKDGRKNNAHERNLLWKKDYRKSHKDQISLYHKKYIIWKRANDLNYRIADSIRNRLRLALKGNSKTGTTLGLLGCSIVEFMFYIEGKFKEGMTWKNWGVDGWHIDHIIPLSFFI